MDAHDDHNYVLVTGPSASGKTTVARFFKKQGKDAYDADEAIAYWADEKGRRKTPSREEWEKSVGFKWLWDEEKLKELLGAHKELYLFGYADNMWDLLGLFDQLYYLAAGANLVLSRIQTEERLSDNEFGRTKEQRAGALKLADRMPKKAIKERFEFIDASLPPEKIFGRICHSADMKVVFVCSEGRCRSPTAARLFNGWRDRQGRLWKASYAGFDLMSETDRQIVAHADVVITMDAAQAPLQESGRRGDLRCPVICLEIHDIYPRDDPELVSLLGKTVPPILNTVSRDHLAG